MVGADVAMMTSALLLHGPEHLRTVEQELLGVDGGARVRVGGPAARSATQAAVDDPAAFERANYQRTLHSWSTPGHLVPSARR